MTLKEGTDEPETLARVFYTAFVFFLTGLSTLFLLITEEDLTVKIVALMLFVVIGVVTIILYLGWRQELYKIWKKVRKAEVRG